MSAESSNYLIATFYKGQTIFKEGQPANAAYLVKSGVVAIQKKIEDRQAVLAYLKPGRIFGEMGIISGEPRNATAIAEEYCELVVIDHEVLSKTLLDSPKIVQSITKGLIASLRSTSKKVTSQAVGNSFIGTCSIIDFMYASHCEKGSDGEPLGIPYHEVCAVLKRALSLSQLEINAFINKLHSVNALQIIERPTKTQNESDHRNTPPFLKLTDPQGFLKTATHFYEEFKDTFSVIETEQESMDINEFSVMVNSTPEMIIKKIGSGEIPENIISFNKRQATEWFHKVGDTFFPKI
ncbi:MAG: Crp/Fnr family transcriptional regulator [Syntrophales bacterium]